MNQAILFNDDLVFNNEQGAWCITAIILGQSVTIYFHSGQLKELSEIDSATQFDLEEAVERWLEKNEPAGNTIHIKIP
ncbi:MAG: hypothetical protein V5789_01225 [Colwellia sp.]